MPNLYGLLSDLVIGNDYDFERSVTSVPEGAVLERAWFTIKRYTWDDDDDAIIQKEITVATVVGQGQILDTGEDDHVGIVFFQLSNVDTRLLHAHHVYYYDCQVLTNTAKVYTVESGHVLPRARVTETVAP